MKIKKFDMNTEVPRHERMFAYILGLGAALWAAYIGHTDPSVALIFGTTTTIAVLLALMWDHSPKDPTARPHN